MRVLEVLAKLVGLVIAAALNGGTTLAQTPIKFSLDWKFEGPAAPSVAH